MSGDRYKINDQQGMHFVTPLGASLNEARMMLVPL